MTPVPAPTAPSQITLYVFLLCTWLTVVWGVNFGAAIEEWGRARRVARLRVRIILDPKKRSAEQDRASRLLISTFRQLIEALILFLLPLAFAFRTGSVLLGAGDLFVTQFLFFVLTGAMVTGSAFCVISRRYD